MGGIPLGRLEKLYFKGGSIWRMIKNSTKQPRLTGGEKVTIFESEARLLFNTIINTGYETDPIIFSQLLNRFTYVVGRLRKARLSMYPMLPR